MTGDRISLTSGEALSLVLTSVGSNNEAEKLSRILVEEGIVACATRFSGHSVYRWNGALEEANEITLLFKVTKEKLPTLMDALGKNHPYDVPEVLVFEVAQVSQAYLAWALS